MTSSLVKEQPGAFFVAPVINTTHNTTAGHPIIAGLRRHSLQKQPGSDRVTSGFFRLQAE
jgi:hypothetical protein